MTYTMVWAEKFLLPSDTGVNKPTAPPVIEKSRTYNYVPNIILDNDNKQLRYLFMYVLQYIFIIILECTLSAYRKQLAVKQYAMLCQ